MSLELKNLNPYLDRESAAAWLRRDLAGGTAVSRKAMYHLNIINHFVQNEKEILKRLPQARLGGLPEGGRRNVAAACILRASEGAGGTQREDVLPGGLTATQERVGHWAERDGCWADFAGFARTGAGYRHLASGSEADVYLDSRGTCHKNIDISHYGSLQGLMDRIAIHNAVFPESAMRVEGFGLKNDAQDHNGFCAMVSQPFITGRAATQEEIARHMSAAGFRLAGVGAAKRLFRFVSEDGMLIHDLNSLNAVLSSRGNVMVFDCDAMLNRHPELGPVHEVPAMAFSERAVRDIGEILEKIVPREAGRLDFEMLYGTRENILHEQLRETGRYEGMIDVRDVGPCLVAADPADRERVLLMPHDSAVLMSRLTGDYAMDDAQRTCMAEGHAVRLDAQTTVAFSLDRGRPVKIRQQRKYRGTMEQVKERPVHVEPAKKTLKF